MQTIPDLTIRLSNSPFRYRGVSKFSDFFRFVYASVLMRDPQQTDHDTLFRPVTIAQLTDPDDRPAHFGPRQVPGGTTDQQYK
jgi:hypothetical protein